MKYIVLCVVLILGQTSAYIEPVSIDDSFPKTVDSIADNSHDFSSEEFKNGDDLIKYNLPEPEISDDYLVYDLTGDSINSDWFSLLNDIGSDTYENSLDRDTDSEWVPFSSDDYVFQPDINSDVSQEDNYPFINFDGGFGSFEELPNPPEETFLLEEPSEVNEEKVASFLDLLRPKSFNVYSITQYFIVQDAQQKQNTESVQFPESSYRQMSHIRLAGPLIMLSILITIGSAMLLIFYLTKRRSQQMEIAQENGAYKPLREDV